MSSANLIMKSLRSIPIFVSQAKIVPEKTSYIKRIDHELYELSLDFFVDVTSILRLTSNLLDVSYAHQRLLQPCVDERLRWASLIEGTTLNYFFGDKIYDKELYDKTYHRQAMMIKGFLRRLDHSPKDMQAILIFYMEIFEHIIQYQTSRLSILHWIYHSMHKHLLISRIHLSYQKLIKELMKETPFSDHLSPEPTVMETKSMD